ncbi:MAG: hypothetical protein OHK0037_06890 [Elainellaceae cyanobacterium]
MFYTTDAPGLSIDDFSKASNPPAPLNTAQSSHHAEVENSGGWIGFAILATLMAVGFAGLTFGSIKLAEGAILSQQGLVGPAVMR